MTSFSCLGELSL